MTATVTNKVNILKRIWGPMVAQPLYKRSKLMLKMRKDTKFGGEGRYVISKITGTAGGSADFATAQANKGASSEVRFFVTRKKEYQVFSIDGELMEASEGNINAVISALKDETKSALYMYGREFAAALWGNGGGSRGQLDSGVTLASTLVELRNVGDITRFEVGKKIQLAEDDGSGASPAGVRTGSLTITGVNRQAGTFTVSANLSTISGATVNDYIFYEGDYSKKMTGVPGWSPLVNPTSGDSFFGVDRSTNDIQRQCGLAIGSATGSTYEAKAINAIFAGNNAGIEVDTLCVNPKEFGLMAIEFGAARRAKVEDKTYKISYQTLELVGPDGTVTVHAEPDVPQGSAWAVKADEFVCRSKGECPMELKADGNGFMMREATSDSYEGRLGSYANIFKENPGNSIQWNW